jgi:hypothetical protein
MQFAAIALTVVAGLGAAALWSQLIYRLTLFYRDHGGQAGMNHVGDGAFSLAYGVSAVCVVAAIAAAVMFNRRLSRLLACGVAATVVGGCVLFYVMHQTGALIEYEEFVKIYGP